MQWKRALASTFTLGLLVSGCQSEPGISQQLDAASAARLALIPDGEAVLVSIHLSPLPQTIPGLAEGDRELVRVTDAALVEMAKSEVAKWSPGALEAAAVWGPASAVNKLDGALRRQLLESWSTGSEEPMGLIARFLRESENLKETVTNCGAASRTVAGPIVTLDATPEAIFCLMASPDLVSLGSPRPLRPNR